MLQLLPTPWNHHSRSDRNSLSRCIRASICLRDKDRLIILVTNDCSGLVTVAACCSRPMGDGSSSFVQHLWPKPGSMQLILTFGRAPQLGDAVAFLLCLLQYQALWEWSLGLNSGSIGIPSLWKAFKAESIDDAHCVERGSPTRMNSST